MRNTSTPLRLLATTLVGLFSVLAVSIGYWWFSVGPSAEVSNDSVEPNMATGQESVDYRQIAEFNHHQRYRLTDAEEAYRQWIAIRPNEPAAHLGLANLLATCARRHEAVPHYLQLIRLGAVSDFLMLLAKEDGVIVDKAMLQRARIAAPNDPAPLLGLAWHAAESGDRKQAEALLSSAIDLSPNFVQAQVARAGLWVEEQRWQEFVSWHAEADQKVNLFPQTWVQRGKAAEHQGDLLGAIRCYGEAIYLTPEMRQANAALARLLARVDETQLAEQFSDYSVKLQQLNALQDRLFFSDQPNNIESLLELIERYEGVGRFWEAMGWCQIAVDVEPGNKTIRRHAEMLSTKLQGSALRLTDIAATPARLLDLQQYPLPSLNLDNQLQSPNEHEKSAQFSVPEFEENQQAVGLDFTYFNGAAGEPQRRMYEFSGGGVAVVDYDQDGFPDAYFTQGCPWPPVEQASEFSDSLYRNQSGIYFQLAADAFDGFGQDGFGQGVTASDYDSDGFTDIYVANIGNNRLYRNNGDGTFSDVTESANLNGAEWTTSCVIVDLDGDTHPDIYDVNYVQGDGVYERVCVGDDGKPAICMPFDFDATPDVFWINDGAGKFTRGPASATQSSSIGKGLGIVAFRDDIGLKLFVANDTTPNFLLTPNLGTPRKFSLVDQGIVSGVAYSDAGKAQGSMGIAAGDVDQDGLLDFVVTNFLNESNSIYFQQKSGGFVERSQAVGLEDRSLEMLGFGAQFLDANLDGQLELFVANGHIDDLRRMGKAYEMRPQLLGFRDGKFEEYVPERVGAYFENAWLGRAVAKIDWNVDGSEDLLVGHLRSASRLLTNVTTDKGNFLAVRLVGTQSSRDAIGAALTIEAGGQTIMRQLTAGDGYQASNQRHLIVGLGEAVSIDELRIQWPSGQVQQFANIAANQHVLFIEGRTAVETSR